MPLEQYQLSAVTSLYPFNKKHVTIISICPICPSVYLKASNISKLKRSDICAPWRPSLHPDLELPPWGGVPKVHKLSHWPCCTLWRATTSQARTHNQTLNPSAWPRSPSSQRGAVHWRCCQSLSPSLFIFFLQSILFFVKWFDTNRRRSGNTSSEIQRSLPVQWLHWKKLISLFYLFAFVACWAQGNIF